MADEQTDRVIVDGANVVGAGAGGWWRDPDAAMAGLAERLRCYAITTGAAAVLVLDRPQPDLPEGEHGGLTVRHATRRGRDAADDRIVELVAEEASGAVEVITSDRDLAARARGLGALVTGAGTFLGRLEEAGC